MDNIIQVPLNLPDVCVRSTQRTAQGHWFIRVESTLEGARCHRCGRELRDLHGLDAAVRLRHLPLFDVPVFVEIWPTRARCPTWAGHPTTMQRCAWDEPRSPHTNAYEPWALRMLINATVADAARTLGSSEEPIDGTLDCWIERACTDRSEGVVSAIEEEVPGAEVVIDRFHVARAYRDGADMVRKRELKRLKRALPKAEYAEITGGDGAVSQAA
jgi:transposase